MRLCRDVYHCLPSELAQEDWGTIMKHLVCSDVEAKAGKLRRNPRAK